MKQLAADESLSEEARESAKKALEVLVSSELVEIEQAAALRKIESEAQFVNKQASIERHAEQDAALEKLEAEAQFKRKKAEAKKLLLQASEDLDLAEGLSDDMVEWLGQQRLQKCAEDIARIAGSCATAPPFCTNPSEVWDVFAGPYCLAICST